jgi:hypothetical protein
VACIIATNVARPEPRQSFGRGCVTEIRLFSTPLQPRRTWDQWCVQGRGRAGSIVADERTPRSDRFVSKDKADGFGDTREGLAAISENYESCKAEKQNQPDRSLRVCTH